MAARGDAARAVLRHVNLLLAMYGGAALVTGSLVYWRGDLADLTQEGRTAAVALGAGGGALLLLAHAGAAAASRTALLLLALGAWFTALGVLGVAGGLAWQSTSFDVGGEPTVNSYLCALLNALIVDKQNQPLLAKAGKIDEKLPELLGVGAMVLLLLLLLVLVGALALFVRSALNYGSTHTHSSLRRSSSMYYEMRAPRSSTARTPPPPVPSSASLYKSPLSLSQSPFVYE